MSIDFDDWLGKAISSVKTPDIQFWEIKNVEWETAGQLRRFTLRPDENPNSESTACNQIP